MSESTRKVVVLGAGMVGQAIARDLADDAGLRVDVADVRAEALEQVARRADVGTVRADLANPDAVKRLVAAYELAVGALPSAIGLQTLRAVLEAGRHCVDISFMPEDALSLDALARGKGVTAVVDCGVAPGLSNMMCGAAAARLAPLEEVEIYVGGLPVERRWPFDYKAGFAPSDVLEEYTRPSRVVEHGRLVVKEPLSEPELLDFPGVGTLEAFNTDGLRSILFTCPEVPAMREMTLRYPGHIDKIRVLRESGFFGTEPIEVGGTRVRPLDLAAKLLFAHWRFAPGEEDVTVFRVEVEGTSGGESVRLVHDLFDRTDRATGTLSMARTTGYTCTAGVRLLAAGRFPHRGVFPPELVPGKEAGAAEFFLSRLAERGVQLTSRRETMPS